MATVDERVAFLEGRVNEQSLMINGIREALVSLEQRMDRRFESIEQRLNALDQKVDAGFAAMNLRMDTALATLDQKIDAGLAAVNQKMDAGFAALDRKIDHRFAWVVGIQLTTTVAVVGTVLAALLAR